MRGLIIDNLNQKKYDRYMTILKGSYKVAWGVTALGLVSLGVGFGLEKLVNQENIELAQGLIYWGSRASIGGLIAVSALGTDYFYNKDIVQGRNVGV
jgi:hypothetical protein